MFFKRYLDFILFSQSKFWLLNIFSFFATFSCGLLHTQLCGNQHGVFELNYAKSSFLDERNDWIVEHN